MGKQGTRGSKRALTPWNEIGVHGVLMTLKTEALLLAALIAVSLIGAHLLEGARLSAVIQ